MKSMAGLAFASGAVLASLSFTDRAFAQAVPSLNAASPLMRAAFRNQPYPAVAPSLAMLLSARGPYGSDILSVWKVNETVLGLADDSVPVDTLRLQVLSPAGAQRALQLGADVGDYDVSLVRNWPHAMSFTGETYDVDITPHAGLGIGSLGGSAEAGATLTLGRKSSGDSVTGRLRDLGFREASLAQDAGRWYIFAAASGRAVGLSLATQSPGSDWTRTQDSASALIGDAQLGVGWRRGDLQASVGYVHRSVKGDHMLWGQQSPDDSMVAFSFSVKPRR